ncbi:MAG: SGNH/GDSL hydrolase family protein [Chloroflexi bacterium]|nr:SGNH/GDSL hydrolase family protein [Chloroflexota bacterium]
MSIAADYLLPNTSPGINLQQLVAILAGLTIAFAAMQIRREKVPMWLAGRTVKRTAVILVIIFITLLALEMVLRLQGTPTYFAVGPVQHELIKAPWSTCDAAGCHYVYDAVVPACESGLLEGRVCAVNRQGYSDVDNFLWDDEFEDMARVLLLGDSFTFGMSADLGKSFAERLDADFPQAVIWNTGIPGGGTHQALAAFNVYASVLQPQITILGFYVNDFDDNLMPVDSWLNAIDPDGNAVAIRLNTIDEWENVIHHTLSDIEYFRTYWKFPPASEFQRQLGLTQLGTLLLRLIDRLQTAGPKDSRFEVREQVTRQYLQELREAVEQAGSGFLVLLVPGPADIEREGMRYQLAREIVSDLAIPHIDPIDLLKLPADYAPPPDDHWSNAGHQKIGALLGGCLKVIIAGEDISDCAHVTMPRN